MTFKPMQNDVDEWIRNYTPGYFEPLMMMARLTEELGELSRAVCHRIGTKRPKPGEDAGDVSDELGDLIFVAVCLANSLGIDLDDSWVTLKKKLYERDATRWKD